MANILVVGKKYVRILGVGKVCQHCRGVKKVCQHSRVVKKCQCARGGKIICILKNYSLKTATYYKRNAFILNRAKKTNTF